MSDKEIDDWLYPALVVPLVLLGVASVFGVVGLIVTAVIAAALLVVMSLC